MQIDKKIKLLNDFGEEVVIVDGRSSTGWDDQENPCRATRANSRGDKRNSVEYKIEENNKRRIWAHLKVVK